MNENDICCEPLDPKKWHNKTITFKNKKFIKARVRTFFYMPLNMTRVMKKIDKRVAAAGASYDHGMMLSDHTSKWNMDIYVAVDKTVPNVDVTSLSGDFYTRIYHGPYSDTQKWWDDFTAHMKKMKLKFTKVYMWYATCPKCAKKYNRQETVFVAKLK